MPSSKLIQEVSIEPKPTTAFETVLGPDNVESVSNLAAGLQARLGGRTIWNVNSTAAGGGVAEMLHTLLAYARRLGCGHPVAGHDRRQSRTFSGSRSGLHNALHGELGDGSDARRGGDQGLRAKSPPSQRRRAYRAHPARRHRDSPRSPDRGADGPTWSDPG